MLQDEALKDLGYVQIVGLAASTPLTIPAGCRLILATPQTQAVRWRADGVAPTATVGYPLAVGAELRYTGSQMSALRFFEQVATATLNVYFFG